MSFLRLDLGEVAISWEIGLTEIYWNLHEHLMEPCNPHEDDGTIWKRLGKQRLARPWNGYSLMGWVHESGWREEMHRRFVLGPRVRIAPN